MDTTTSEQSFRVYRVPQNLKAAMQADRATRDISLGAYLEQAVELQLPAITKRLEESGFMGAQGAVGPARWPVTTELLGTLRDASEQVGLPASQLLLACLAIHSKDSRVEAPKAKQSRGSRGTSSHAKGGTRKATGATRKGSTTRKASSRKTATKAKGKAPERRTTKTSRHKAK